MVSMQSVRVAATGFVFALTPIVCAAEAAEPVPVATDVAQPGVITVISASFGTIGKKDKLDLLAPLQGFCAGASERCDVPCSETSFGRYRLGKRPVCRVTWRCPDGNVRSTEAAREELILMRCPRPERMDVAVDQLILPSYVPPAR